MKRLLAIIIASVMVLSLAANVSARYSLDRLFVNENDRLAGEAAGQPISGPTGEPVRINPGDRLYILGWAVSEYGARLDKIVYTVDGGENIDCTGEYRDRPDVAAAFGLDPVAGEGAGFGYDGIENGGMMELTGIDELPEGVYEIAIKAVFEDGSEEVFDQDFLGKGVFTLLVGDVEYDPGSDDPDDQDDDGLTEGWGRINFDAIYANVNVMGQGNSIFGDMRIDPGDKIYILGWAYGDNSNLREIVYSIDGGSNVHCSDNYRDRPDVAWALGISEDLGRHAGFGTDNYMFELNGIDELDDGTYGLAIKAVFSDDTYIAEYFTLIVGEGGGSVIIEPTGDGEWHWISGEPFEYTHWGDGEPNGGDDEPRMAIWPDFWNDLCIDSYEQGGYICEWNDEESGSYAYNGHSYRIYRGHYSWDDAEAKCEQMGGYLACITSREEQAFIESIKDPSDELWIGGYYGGGEYTGETGGDDYPEDERHEVTGWLCGEEPDEMNPRLWFNPVGEPDDRFVEYEFTSAIYFNGIRGFFYCSNINAGFDQATMLIELRRYGELVAVKELSCNGDTWYNVDFEEVFEPGDYTLKFSCLSGSGIENNCWFVIGYARGEKCCDIYCNTVSTADYDEYPVIMLIDAEEPAVSSGMLNIDRIYVNHNELDGGDDVKGDDPIQIDPGDKLYIIGWAYGSENLKEIVYSVNGGADISCPDNYRDRYDMASMLGIDSHLGEHAGIGHDDAASGGMMELTGIDQLEDGTYIITIKAVFNDGTSCKKFYTVQVGEGNDEPDYPPVDEESGMLNIDRIYVNHNELDGGNDVKTDDPICIMPGDKLYILGWALGENDNLREIVYSIDGGADISCPDNYRDREDVAWALGRDPYLGEHAGFGHDDAASGGMLELTGIDQLADGTYELVIKAVFNDGSYRRQYYTLRVGNGDPYYPPVGEESGRLNIDRMFINANDMSEGTDVKDNYQIEINEGDRIYILGWAYGDYENLKEIVYTIDGGQNIKCPDNYRDRVDVAAAFGLPYYFGEHAGFGHDSASEGGLLELSGINNLTSGEYQLTIKAIFNDNTYCSRSYELVVVGSGNPDVPEDEEPYEHELQELESGMLNIVIDGGTSQIKARPGDEIDVRIELKNNSKISSLKIMLKYDKYLSVATDSKGKTKVTFDIYDPDDDSAMRGNVLDAENNRIILNWMTADGEVLGDTVYATVTFKVSEDAPIGRFLPIKGIINQNDVFDIEQNNIKYNLINGGVDVFDHEPGEIEFDNEYHWHRCLICGEILDKAEHTDSDKDGVCDVCGYVYKIKGDINGDKEINNKDIVALFRYISANSTGADMFVYDFNSDGEINNKDVVTLFRYVSTKF